MSGFTANIEDPRAGKHTLLVVKPRIRLTGWSDQGSNVFRATFPYSFYVSGVSNLGANDAWRLVDDTSELTTAATYFFDPVNNYIYVYSNGFMLTPDNPDDYDFPGLTIEFELHLSDQAFIGPRDPLSAGSDRVNWIPALPSSPLAQIGSRDTIYGFVPMNSSVIDLLNHDGFLNPIAYLSSFFRATVKAYILANANLVDGATFSEVKEIFKGFATGFRMSDAKASITCTDFLSFFDKQVSLRRITETIFGSAIDPRARVTNREYFIPRIFGVLEHFQPINVDYNATPSTTNNRDWVTHDQDLELDGVTVQDPGTLTYNVNTGGANTNSRTYFTTQPKVRVGDSMVIKRNGVNKYTFISAVGVNYVDHEDLGTSTTASGDTGIRYFIGTVTIKESDDTIQTLKAGQDYTVLIDGSNRVCGFTLVDNVEAGFSITPFDPSTSKISCTVYGRVGQDLYSDASPVGQLVDAGGVNAQAVATIYRLVRDASIEEGDVAEVSFQNLEADSYGIGLVIPANRSQQDIPTYREVLNQLLNSNLYKMAVIEEGTLKLGLVQVGPMPAVDYRASELQHRSLEFEHDYANVYSDVLLQYKRLEVTDTAADDTPEYSSVAVENLLSSYVHFIDSIFGVTTLLYDDDEASELAQRFSFLLGDRRGFWTVDLELPFTTKSNLGATYELSRQKMPGQEYVEGTQRTQNMVVTEVNKNSGGVNITFEDQKGIQDNSADW